jgi:CRISPR-associated protein Csb3
MPDQLIVPIDPCNPCHFLACCGLLELLDERPDGVLSHFVIHQGLPRRAEFCLSEDYRTDLERSLSRLRSEPIAKLGGPEKAEAIRWGKHELDWWLDEFRAEPGEFKMWAGQQTSLNLFEALRELFSDDAGALPELFDAPAMTTTRFNLDPRSAWLPIDLGYSPNEQRVKGSVTYPAAELLAAVGLQGFRPTGSRRTGFRYALWLDPLPRAVCRLACSEPWPGLPVAVYRFRIQARGQQKCFTFAQKEKLDHE